MSDGSLAKCWKVDGVHAKRTVELPHVPYKNENFTMLLRLEAVSERCRHPLFCGDVH